MRVTYNWLKDFVDIRLPAQALADKLTMAGLEVTALEARAGDFIFEIEVTSNRADCLSVAGIAREVAAVTGRKLKSSCVVPACPRLRREASRPGRRPASCVKAAERAAKQEQQLSIIIEDKGDCPLYTAKIVRGVRVGPSPEWLKARLELIGCRPVNNVVDITNYIMFSFGEPLHAFDLDRLSAGAIIIRRAKEGEKIITIDGRELALGPGVLLIADKDKPVALAGIMGGKDTEVSEHTKNILLEAAAFNPLVVRRARQKLGLQSESAYRFERGVDLKAVDYSSWQAVNLIQGLCAGKCVLSRSRGSAETKRSSVKLEAGGVSKVLGVKVMAPRIKSILESLGFKARPAGKNALLVEVPSFRPDAKTAIDLIEEISRIYGYENVPRTLPRVSTEITPDKERDLVWRIKNILVGLGVNEVITYSLIDNSLSRSLFENGAPPGLKPGVPCGAESRPASIPGLKAGVLWRRDKDAAAVEIANPLSQEQEILRPTLVPSLIKCVAYNLNQKQPLVNIFEVANVFSAATPGPKEEPALGVAICGTRSLLLEQGLVKEEPGFLHLKGLLEVLFSRLGIKNYGFSPAGRLRISVELNQKKIGAIIKIESDNLGKFDIKNRDVFVLEVRLQEILANADLGKKYSPLPLYPGIARDISIVLKDNISAADILRAVEAVGKPLLKELNIIDYYKGKQIPAGFRSLTLSCLYRSDERTLTEAEIAPTHSLICSLLIDKYAAKIR